MRSIAILDCPEIECPPVLVIVFNEMCTAFTEKGYTVRLCKSISDLTNNDIVFMGNSFHCQDPESLLYTQAPEAIYVGWYWHDITTNRLKFIYTYENALVCHDRIQKVLNKIHCPLPLRASEDSLKVGTYPKNITHDYCYIGPWAYSRELRPTRFNGFVHDNYGVENFLDYETRKHAYLMSTFALGFQSKENIEDKHVSQRVYESLAYGCLTFSNSHAATEQTEGIVIHVTTKEDLEEKMEYYLQHPEESEMKRTLGYEFIRKYGTNHYTADLFLETIRKNFVLNNEIENTPMDFLSNSQAAQDEFVYRILRKSNGTFFDIGSQDPININNTYALEQMGWRGYMFDINPEWVEPMNKLRRSQFILTDVSTFDWYQFLNINGIMNSRIDYLSFDVDEASLATIRRFPFDNVSFNVCTIEHDRYRFGASVAEEMRSIMQSNGYHIVCKDVCNMGNPYEDWYVHDDILPTLDQFYCEGVEWTDVIKNIRSSFPKM